MPDSRSFESSNKTASSKDTNEGLTKQNKTISKNLVICLLVASVLIIAKLLVFHASGDSWLNGDIVSSLVDALITASFAAAMIELLTRPNVTESLITDAHRKSLTTIFTEGLHVEGLSDSTCTKTARNALVRANHFDKDTAYSGYIDICLKELGERLRKPFFTKMQASRTYRLLDASTLMVDETIEADCYNPTENAGNIRMWGVLAIKPVSGNEPFSELKLTQSVFDKNGDGSPRKVGSTIQKDLDPTIENQTRTFAHPDDLLVSVPARQAYSVSLTRRYCIPKDETKLSVCYEEYLSKETDFKIHFIDCDVDINAGLKACTFCDHSGMCFKCEKENSSVLIDSEANQASIHIGDWISGKTELRFEWDYI